MKKIFLLLLAATGLVFCQKVAAQTYISDKTIALPGNGGYDYVYIDQDTHTLYASHGTAVNVVDLQTEKSRSIVDSGSALARRDGSRWS